MKTARKRAISPRIKNERLRDTSPTPLIGYMRVSKADGSQVLDLQHDALKGANDIVPGSCEVDFG